MYLLRDVFLSQVQQGDYVALEEIIIEAARGNHINNCNDHNHILFCYTALYVCLWSLTLFYPGFGISSVSESTHPDNNYLNSLRLQPLG